MNAADQKFNKITQTKFAKMRDRCKAKYSKRGRLLRAPIPFTLTLEQFRDWVLAQFQTVNGVARCAYCAGWLTIDTFVPDHEIALRRGGASGTENLAVSCADCNEIKSAMSASSFRLLITCLQQMPTEDANSVTGRLLKSEKLASKVRRAAAAARNNPAVQPVHPANQPEREAF